MNFKKQNEKDCQEDFCLSSSQEFKDFKEFQLNKNPQKNCPLKREMLGYFSWSILHSFTFAYPDHPTDKDRKSMHNFFEAFARFYPCKFCAGHFQNDLKQDPPNLKDKKSLVLWLCKTHNKTNKLLGKEEFDCDYENLKQRWFKNPHCDSKGYQLNKKLIETKLFKYY